MLYETVYKLEMEKFQLQDENDNLLKKINEYEQKENGTKEDVVIGGGNTSKAKINSEMILLWTMSYQRLFDVVFWLG